MRALVLCAGFGTRLAPLTAETPKPLVEVGGYPLVSLILANLVRQDIQEIAVNVHFQAGKIARELENRPVPGAQIRLVREAELLGTLGTAKSLEDYLASEGPFLLHYGDILTDAHFDNLVSTHRERDTSVTIAVHRHAGSNSVAVIDPDGWVTRFCERPDASQKKTLDSDWAFSGIALVSAEALARVPRGNSDLPRDLLSALAAERKLAAAPLRGYRCAVDSPERLEEVRDAVTTGRCQVFLPRTYSEADPVGRR